MKREFTLPTKNVDDGNEVSGEEDCHDEKRTKRHDVDDNNDEENDEAEEHQEEEKQGCGYCQYYRRKIDELEKEVAKLKKEAAASARAMTKAAFALSGTQAGSTMINAVDPEMLQEKANKKKQLINKAICKAMVWKDSCKSGTSKWSYEGTCTFPELLTILNLPVEGTKPFKAKKIPIEEFQEYFGSIGASARYSSMYLRGEHVNLHYNPLENQLKLSGNYGVAANRY